MSQSEITAIQHLLEASSHLQWAIKRGDFDVIGVDISEEYQALIKAQNDVERMLHP